MPQPAHSTAKLPRQLLDELGTSVGIQNFALKQRGRRGDRKEQRKAARVEKKKRKAPITRRPLLKPQLDKQTDVVIPAVSAIDRQIPPKAGSVQLKTLKSILKRPRSLSVPITDFTIQAPRSPSPSATKKLSRCARDRLAADVEIAALEKALGVEGKKRLPKEFEDDGFEALLEDLDEVTKSIGNGKRKRDEGKEWLDNKRMRAGVANLKREGDFSLEERASEGTVSDMGFSIREIEGDRKMDGQDTDKNGYISFESEEKVKASAAIDEAEMQPSVIPKKRFRENPYVAPVVPSATAELGKYVPLSLRKQDISQKEDLTQLRRQIQGLLNRLSEANMISIVGNIEKLYQHHPRQHVSTTLIDLLVGLLSDPMTLQDTFIILHGGFMAAIYKMIGTDFGAQAISKIYEDFEQNYNALTVDSKVNKKLANLVNLLADLYNFQVVGSDLIYDFIRLFLVEISEIHTELLLKIISNAGQQLRQDDPSSLKDIVLQVHAVVSKEGEENLSVRTKFMIETINNLKNNRMKTGIAASMITSEHTTRMKKTLGSLNQRSIKASEPLRIGLHDLQNTDKRGKWWLVGATFRDGDQEKEEKDVPNGQASRRPAEDRNNADTASENLVQLAREQRMNTDVRRSIFIAVMSATDSNDAYVRLMKLRLKRRQELEIPKVLIHCSGAENVYNPFYTLLSRRVCSDRKLKMAYQFSLWDLLKQMGEGDESTEEDEEDEVDGKLGMRAIVNLARLFGALIVEGGLSLGVLKTLNLAYLQPKTRTFVELLLTTVILESQNNSGGRRNEASLMDLFLKPKEMPEMAPGLRYFLKKTLSVSGLVNTKRDQDTVKWGCKIIIKALKSIALQTSADE